MFTRSIFPPKFAHTSKKKKNFNAKASCLGPIRNVEVKKEEVYGESENEYRCNTDNLDQRAKKIFKNSNKPCGKIKIIIAREKIIMIAMDVGEKSRRAMNRTRVGKFVSKKVGRRAEGHQKEKTSRSMEGILDKNEKKQTKA
jgi:hypothetical protein